MWTAPLNVTLYIGIKMKIELQENPLNTKVFLDEHEKEVLFYKVKIAQMEDLLFRAHYYLINSSDIEEVTNILNPNYYLDDNESKLDEYCKVITESYILDLQNIHCGDCICFAMTCSKCMAENYLGISTFTPSKYVGHRVDKAFSYRENDEWKYRTIDEALEYLSKDSDKLGTAAYEYVLKHKEKLI